MLSRDKHTAYYSFVLIIRIHMTGPCIGFLIFTRHQEVIDHYTVKSECFKLLHRVLNSVSLTHCECFDHERVLRQMRVLREHVFGVVNVT